MGKISEQLYAAIISHANVNIHTVGRSLFNDPEKIDLQMEELQETNNMAKYAAIESLKARREYIILIYAKNNKLI